MIDVTDSNAVYYYHFDGLGSVIALSNNNGDIVEQYEYDVFGRPDRVSDVNNPYFFTGRRYDDETGLYYYRARYYDPYIGRFLQTDPIGYSVGLNLYTYVNNNPVIYVDPYGLWGDHDFGSGRFDYNRFDSGWTHPWNPFSTGRHFRDRNDAIRDAIDAAERGDQTAFEDHMHELQDTFSHGEGLLGVIDHIIRSVTGNDPDDPFVRGPDGEKLIGPDGKPIYKPEFDEAEKWTRQLEKYWDECNKEVKK